MKIKRAIAAAIAAAMTATSCLVCELPAEAAAAVPTAKLVGVSANAYVCPIDTLTFDEGTRTYTFTITNDSNYDDTYVGGSLTINFFDYNEMGSDYKVVSVTNANGVKTEIDAAVEVKDGVGGYWFSDSELAAIGAIPAGKSATVEIAGTYSSVKDISANCFKISRTEFTDMEIGDSFTITFDKAGVRDTAKYSIKYMMPYEASDGTIRYNYYAPVYNNGINDSAVDNVYGGKYQSGLDVSSVTNGDFVIYTFTAVSRTQKYHKPSFGLTLEVSQSGVLDKNNQGFWVDTEYIGFGVPTAYFVPTPVSGVTIDNKPAVTTYTLGDSVALTASVDEDATVPDPEIVWSSDNENAATVDSTGNVSFVGGGKATITAAYKDDITIKDTVTFTVNVPVSSVTINKPAKTEYTVGEQVALTASADENTTVVNPEFVWSSDNENAATVDSTGNVSFVGGGKATITAAYKDDITIKDTITFTVSVPVSSVTIETPDKTEYMVGESVILSASVNEDATVSAPTILWSSSDTKVATVDGSGEVKFVGSGSVTITAAYADDTSVKGTITLTAVPDTRDTYIETPIDYTKATVPTLVKTSDGNSLLYVMAVTKAQAEADELVFISVKDKDTGKTARYYTKDVYKGFGFIGENGQKYVETGADGIYFVIVKFTNNGAVMNADRYTVDMELITPVG